MAKKTLIAFAIIVLSFCCGVCFAEERNSNINLGNDISNSINDSGNGVESIANEMMDGTIMNSNTNTNRTSRDYTSTTTNSYNAYRTDTTGTIDTANTAMSTTTWIWIILALAAIIIVAMIWYYAVQSNDTRN